MGRLAVRVAAVVAAAAVKSAEVATSAGESAVIASPSTSSLVTATMRNTKLDVGALEALACVADGEHGGNGEKGGSELHFDE